ncbi:MAG: hypothetical protein A3C90_00240 [Candidatus Magasanikbacteria bacterium RIFCSPHIGHO2_02_FULL_51_14]|uniref:Acylneuraminate cytidylyltransferase n=1 Tax=Candidatus Magasanikbacteria bacterium RIFCSPHIGHO2_02_FULL_51_14 TaxID=1798683 RepID=A0A1F6MD41_9BACT|nr:MAG: hypothetical protein A3C90_00240 [Candidatus Magasanikbacteria bacterium RIFCSPHIGHO2_02_FULL_51_14]
MFNEYKHIAAIIPARGGSKRIPRKNLAMIAGKPMIAYSIEDAMNARLVDRVIVSTEDEKIADVSRQYGADVIDRPQELAQDGASSESALLHVLDELEKRGERKPDLLVFLQCTSPMRYANDIDTAVETLARERADSLFSAARNFGLIWAKGERGLHSITHEYATRRREQDMDEQYRENGSLYVFKPEILRSANNRLGGTIAIYEMDMWTSFQVDSPEDLELAELIIRHRKGIF